ncbi:hypothetical protein BC835DRAFT_345673 [Cytidiella melzeri]|nr:hypothetical protein BC835DRAFT_345673 [Cytidiella melzeri]
MILESGPHNRRTYKPNLLLSRAPAMARVWNLDAHMSSWYVVPTQCAWNGFVRVLCLSPLPIHTIPANLPVGHVYSVDWRKGRKCDLIVPPLLLQCMFSTPNRLTAPSGESTYGIYLYPPGGGTRWNAGNKFVEILPGWADLIVVFGPELSKWHQSRSVYHRNSHSTSQRSGSAAVNHRA